MARHVGEVRIIATAGQPRNNEAGPGPGACDTIAPSPLTAIDPRNPA